MICVCVQVKLMRSTERVNSRGVGRSMGYGFVELSSHTAALTALRGINNNPDLFGKQKVRGFNTLSENGREVEEMRSF